MTTTTPDFFDRLTTTFTSAIACIQENTQLKTENAQLKADNEDLTSKLNAVTSSLNEDEQQKATNATKLAALEQLVTQYESLSTSVSNS